MGCAILGNNNLIIGEVDEIDLPNDFFDYNMKYKSSTNRIILPANLSQNERNRINLKKGFTKKTRSYERVLYFII